ncbi:Protein furry [Taenia crassiceps]|uniref:Protein furry n=1 Tax=Taenia crassiceps TaxID=6207 RepID=A0ABR4Q647_9CEST
MVVTMFSSNAATATSAFGVGLGRPTTVVAPSPSVNTVTASSSLPSAATTAVATSINSPVGAAPGGGIIVGAIATCGVPVAPASTTAGGAGGSVGVSGGGGGGIGAGGATAGVSGGSVQNPSVAAATTTPSATAAASAAPAHAPTGVDPMVLTEMRLYFCVFIRDLIRHLPRERRQRLFPPVVRRNLVLLIARWSGFYEHMYNAREAKWGQPPWTDHLSGSLTECKYFSPPPPSLPPLPPVGMDQVISGDLVLSISGVHLDSTPQDPFIAASFLDNSIWLELLWYANQSIAALVCCGAIYDTLALFTTPTATQRLAEGSDTALSGSGMGHQFHQISTNISTTTGTGAATSTSSSNAASSTTVLASGAVVEEECGPLTLSTVATTPLASTSAQALSSVAITTQIGSGFSSSGGQPAPGYIFHWLKGLLLCRDGKLSISPWLWGLPVVNFGVCSTALKGPYAKTGMRNIRLEDNLRSIVIAAAAGRRLDSLFRQLGEETLVLLLDMNPDLPGLLEILVDQCYTGPLNVIQAFFVIITQYFIKNPKTHCDKFVMLTLAMVFCEHSVPVIRENAIFLLQTLYYRFFLLPVRELHQHMHPECQQIVTSTPVTGNAGELNDSQTGLCLSALADELLWREIGHWKPCDVLRQFCAQHPTYTLPMISEICRRLATASNEVRCRLIKLLHYWAINIELVDLFAQGYDSKNNTACGLGDGIMETCSGCPEDVSTVATLEPISPSGKMDVATTWEPSSGSDLELEEESVGRQHSSVSSNSSVSSSSASSSISSSDSSSSCASHSSSISTGSSNIDMGECCSSAVATSNIVALRKPQCDYKPNHSAHQNHEDAHGRNQGRILEHSFKPELDGERQKANALWASVPLTLRRSGYGCLKATEMVLNNFFYLTIRFANESNEASVLGDLWVLLIRYRPANLRFILRYLIVAASLAPATLCSHVNRVVSFLTNEDPSSVVDVLMTELQTIDGAGLMIEPSPFPPFFHIAFLSDLIEHSPAASTGVTNAATTAVKSVLTVTATEGRKRQTNLPEAVAFSQKNNEVHELLADRGGVMTTDTGHQAASARPVSACSGGWRLNEGDDETAIISPKSTVEPSPPATTASAISRLTNRFASSATAMGRRALRTALHPGGGRQSKTSVTLDQGQPQELDTDSLDGEADEECRVVRTTADTMPTPQNQNTTTTEALITAKSQTLPYTAASRERYSKQTVVGMDGTPLSRPSRLRKILSRRRAATGDKGGSGGGRRNPFRSIFRGSGSGGGGNGGCGDVAKPSGIVAKVSDGARLCTTSLPPNLALLQPLPLPLHSHSISHINDYRRKRKGGRHRRSSPRRLRRRHRGTRADSDGNQRARVPLSSTSLLLQQPLPMPKDGNVYHAPLRDWFTEPFVTNGSLVFSGMWSPTGARSPLVLVLVGEILKSHNKHRVAWRKHMPLLLLCLFLGLDHCRPLVQEESKQLLVNMLRVVCPRIDLLRLLSLQLEIDAQWIARAINSFALRGQPFCLTLDGGPSVPKFYLPASTDNPLTEVSPCPTWMTCCVPSSSSICALSVTGTAAVPPAFTASGTSPNGLSPLTDAPPLTVATATTSSSGIIPRPSLLAHHTAVVRPSHVFGSTYSLMSTATLIPTGLSAEQESKRRSIVLNDAPLPPPSSQLPTSSTQRVGVVTDKASATLVDEMAVATTPYDCEAKHLHLVAETIGQLLEEVQDRSIWTWEDITPSRFQQATLVTLRSILPPHPPASPQPRKSLLLLRSACFLDRFVRCVAEAFAEAEAGYRCKEAASCLRCHHGAPHRHLNDAEVEEVDNDNLGGGGGPGSEGSAPFLSLHPGCTVTRFAQAAFNMGITCPNRHYASRSLQIYRALDAQLDEKSLSEVLVRLVESVSDANEELQSYMVELFLTLEAAVGHIQYRGTVLSPSTISIGRFATRSRCSAPDSPLTTSKPPQPPQSAPPFLLPPQAPPSTPPVHERRHSRRGSSSSLSSLLGYPAAIVGNTAVPAPSLAPMQQTSGLTVPPIKRPLMPPHAEAVSEEADVAPVVAPSVSTVGPMKSTLMPPLQNANMCANNAGSAAVTTNDARRKSVSGDLAIDLSAGGTCRLAPEEQADLLAGIFWIGVCLLDSDYEYEYLAGIRLLSRLLPCVCSPFNTASTTSTTSSGNRKWNPQQQQNSPSLHDHALKLLHRLKWTTGTEDGDYPGLLGLLLKGCFSSTLIDTSCRLLVHLIPAVKSPIVDPNAENRQYRRAAMSGNSRSTGSSTPYPGSLPSLVIALLPMLLTSWDEDPESPASTVLEAAVYSTEACEACTEGPGSPAVASSFPLPSSFSPPPPLGSWVHRSVVLSETTVPPPSSGQLSLVTAILGSGAVAKRAPQLRPRNPICILAAEQLADLALQMDAYRFHNLAIVLRLYANGAFSKDVNQWAKCVTRYLMDGCAGLGPRILTFLTTFLTLGPPCVQLSLLHFGYWFLQAVELSQSEMSTRIRTFITATSERFVNTPLWPEVTLLYQVVVARSAILTAAPSNPEVYSLPGLDPSGSGRVLDSLAAAAAAAVPLPEAEPQRIALAGRVLDFDSSVLQSAPLIAGGRGQASPRLGATSAIGQNQHRSPARTAHLVEVCGLSAFSFSSFFRLGTWKTPWNRQARLRGLFANLLSCYGSELDHLTAPRSPSNSSKQKVIFSQSTETLDRQLSMHSSSETTSINDASNPDDGHFDDTSSAERAAVFHDLDTYLDAQLMNINFLDLPDAAWEDQSRCPWGVRGHSITSHAEFHEEGDDQQQPESQPLPQKQQKQANYPSDLSSVCEDGTFANTISTTGEPFVILPPAQSQLQRQHPPEGEELEVEDVEEEEDEDDEEEEELEREGGDFLAVGAPTVPGLVAERQSQLSLQLSVSSSAAPVAAIDLASNAALLAPSTLHRRFNSQLLIAWTSRDDSPVKWLMDAFPTVDMNTDNASNISAIMQGYQGTQSIPRKLTLSMHPQAICSRRRRQALTTFGGSLDSLPSRTNGQSITVLKRRSCAVPKNFEQSSSTSSFTKVPTLTPNGVTNVVGATVPSVKPPCQHRCFRRSLELGIQQTPDLSLRMSRSSNALGCTVEGVKPLPTASITPQQLLIPTPSETAWMTCQRQLKSLQQSSMGAAMASAQADRLRLLVTGLRSTFSGMLHRTTLQAVKLANSAFCQCPPSSDLDPEIRISNLIRIAEIMGDALPLPFFAIHPNSVVLIDEHSVSLCLKLGTAYEEWEEAIRQLAVTCAPSGVPDWLQHERICRDLQEVLQRLLLFFRSSTDVLTSVYRHLVDSSVGVTDFSASSVEPLFARLQPFILTSPPSLPPNSQEVGGMEAWKPRCARLLLWPSYGFEDVHDKRALAIYAAAMKSTAPISMDDIMTILEACCEHLWTGSNCNSGVALMFAQSRTMESHRFEAFSPATSTVPTSAKTSTHFFPTDDLLLSDCRATLPPLELAGRLLRLLES